LLFDSNYYYIVIVSKGGLYEMKQKLEVFLVAFGFLTKPKSLKRRKVKWLK